MKRSALFCVLLAVLSVISGCSPKSGREDGIPAESAFMPAFENRAVMHGNVLYFVDDSAENNPVIFTYDLGTGSSMPLCFKPECEHKDKLCGGYIEDETPQLAVYGEQLYFTVKTGLNSTLYRENLDGTGREKVMLFDVKYEQYFMGMTLLGIYDDTVYRCGYGAEVEDADAKNNMVLYSMPLGGEESTEILRLENVGWSVERISGNKLYVAAFSTSDGCTVDIYCFDLDSKELTKLYSGASPSASNDVAVVGNKLMFSFSTECFSYSLDTGEFETIVGKFDSVSYLSENYLYVKHDARTCSIYDLKGNELFNGDRLPAQLTASSYITTYAGSSNDVFYFFLELSDDDLPTEKYLVAFDAKTFEAKLVNEVYFKGRVTISGI